MIIKGFRDSLYSSLKRQTLRIVNFDKNNAASWSVFIGLLISLVHLDLGKEQFNKINKNILTSIINLNYLGDYDSNVITVLLEDKVVQQWINEFGSQTEVNEIPLKDLLDMFERGVLHATMRSMNPNDMFKEFSTFMSNSNSLVKIVMGDYLSILYSNYRRIETIDLRDSIVFHFYEENKFSLNERLTNIFPNTIVEKDINDFKSWYENIGYFIGYRDIVSLTAKELTPMKYRRTEIIKKELPDSLKEDIISYLKDSGDIEEILVLCRLYGKR